MTQQHFSSDMSSKDAVVIYKHSRYSYVLDRGTEEEKRKLIANADPISHDLLVAHENNLACIDSLIKTLHDLRINHHLLCRSDLKKSDLTDRLVIAVGGDGTLLDCSHYCEDSPVLGVNSDPVSSIGALCAANANNFRDMLTGIIAGTVKPMRIARLQVAINGHTIGPLVTNDVLFCHKNPASLSRFTLDLNGHRETHRSSGLWVATAAGSTGGIYSSGAQPLPLADERALFRVREPYWVNMQEPQLLAGSFGANDKLTLICNMTEGEIFIDGPHEQRNISLSDIIEITISPTCLWLYDEPRLNINREKIINRREAIRSFID